MKPYYEDSAVTLYHGDCREIMSLVDGVDHVITDPPYTQRTSENARSGGGDDFTGTKERRIAFNGVDGQEGELATLFVAIARRWVVIFCALEQIGRYAEAAGSEWVRGTVWHRTNSAPQFTGDRPGQACEGVAIMHRAGRKRWNRGGTSLLYVGPTINAVGESGRGTPHPTVKPSWIMEGIIADFTDEDELVLDPFAGSGTTLVAAKKLGRRAIGIEMNEQYCEVAARRLSIRFETIDGGLFAEQPA